MCFRSTQGASGNRHMLIEVSDGQARIVLGAMRRVASAHGAEAWSGADRHALTAFDRFILRRERRLDIDALPDPTPAQLAAALSGEDIRTHVAQFLIVMALVDAAVDEAKIGVV